MASLRQQVVLAQPEMSLSGQLATEKLADDKPAETKPAKDIPGIFPEPMVVLPQLEHQQTFIVLQAADLRPKYLAHLFLTLLRHQERNYKLLSLTPKLSSLPHLEITPLSTNDLTLTSGLTTGIWKNLPNARI